MKTAMVTIASVYAVCGHCANSLTDKHGSELIKIEHGASSEIFRCPECGTDNKLPKRIFD